MNHVSLGHSHPDKEAVMADDTVDHSKLIIPALGGIYEKLS